MPMNPPPPPIKTTEVRLTEGNRGQPRAMAFDDVKKCRNKANEAKIYHDFKPAAAGAGPPRHPPAAGRHILAPFSPSHYLCNAKE